VLNKQRARAAAAATIRKSENRIKRWAKLSDKWAFIGKGLTLVYRRACHTFSAAAADPTVEKLHEWLK